MPLVGLPQLSTEHHVPPACGVTSRGEGNVPASLQLDLFHEDGPRCGQAVTVRGQMFAGEAVVWGGEQSRGAGDPCCPSQIPVVLPSSPKDSSLGETFVFWVFPFAFECVMVRLGKIPRKSRSPSLSSSEPAGDAGERK